MNKCIKYIKQNLILTGSLIIIVVVYLYHLDKYNLLYHLGDEFGYWANAAFMSGFDWSGVASHNTYYSFGYSFVLAPLFLIDNFELRYQAALILNIFFQIISFLLLNGISKRLFKQINRNLSYIISLCITLYTSNVFYSKTTLCESFIYFVFIWIIYLVIKICNENKWIEYILLGILTPLIFSIHMRALGIVVSVGLFLIIEYVTNPGSRKKVIVFILETIILFTVVFFYKNHLIESLYASNETVATNDFSGQTGKIELLFSIKGIWLMIRSIIGKVYYLLSASFLIFAWSILWMKEQIVKKNGYTVKIAFFFLTSFLFTLGISSLYMIGESNIIDNLIYGRYNDFIIGPFLLLGCGYLVEKRNTSVKQYMLIVILYLLAALFVMINFDKITNPSIREANIVGISYLSYNGETCLYNNWEVVITLKVMVVSVITFILLKRNRLYFKFCTFIAIGFIWLYGGIQLLDYQLHYRENYYTNRNIYDYLNQNDIYEITYLMNNNYVYFDSLRPDILQYMNPHLQINYKNIDNILLENERIFFVKKERFSDSEFRKYTCVAKSNDFELYIKNNL